MTTVIVTGPQGSGKSLNAKALARYFGCDTIVDDDEWRTHLPLTPGALHLTSEPMNEGEFQGACVLSIESALQLLGQAANDATPGAAQEAA